MTIRTICYVRYNYENVFFIRRTKNFPTQKRDLDHTFQGRTESSASLAPSLQELKDITSFIYSELSKRHFVASIVQFVF